MFRAISFRSALIISFFVVALIPTSALIQMWWHLQQLSDMSNSTEQQIEKLSDIGHSLGEQGEVFERSSRQWVALDDVSFADTAIRANQELLRLAQQLNDFPDQSLHNLGASLSGWSAVSGGLLLQSAKESKDSLSKQYEQLSTLSKSFGLISKRTIDGSRQIWEQRLIVERKLADRIALASLVLSIAVGVLLSRWISRPVRLLLPKIDRLSHGARRQDWEIKAPNDWLRVADALSNLDKRLSALETEKVRFFRHVSHELKTPLASIKEATSLLSDEIAGPILPQQQELASIIMANVDLLRGRVDTLLNNDVANWLETPVGAAQIRFELLCNQSLAVLEPLLRAKNLKIKREASVDNVWGDAEKLRTVMDNFLSNAIRFSPKEGEIAISLVVENQIACIDVRDQGPGVSDECRNKVFEPFFTGEPPVGEVPGTGIGLTMVKTFAQAMGGDAECIASVSGGWFRIWWPQNNDDK